MHINSNHIYEMKRSASRAINAVHLSVDITYHYGNYVYFTISKA